MDSVIDIDSEVIDNINKALASTFEENGLPTKNIIQNLGSTFVYLICCSFVLFVVYTLILASKLNQKFTSAA
jgi:hypothetical protein